MRPFLKKTLIATTFLALTACQTVPVEQQQAIEQIKAEQAKSSDASLHLDLAGEYLKTAETTNDIEYVYKAVEELEVFSSKEPQHLEGQISLYRLYYDLAARGDVVITEKLRNLFDKLPAEIVKNLNPPSLAEAVYKYRLTGFSDTSGLSGLLKKGIKEQPHSASAHIMLAELYAYKDRYNLAIPLMTKVTKMHPENGQLAQIHAEMLVDSVEKNCLYHEESPYKEALVLLRKALKADSDNPEIHAEIARIYANLGRNNLSLNTYKKYDKLQNDADSKADLISSYIEAGKPDQARAIIDQQLTSKNVSPYFYQHSARFFFIEGELERAAEMWNQRFSSTKHQSFYDALAYSYIDEKLNGRDAALKNFEKNSQQYRDKWQKQLRDYRLGVISKPEILLKTTDACEVTEANYNIALEAWLNGDEKQKKRHLQEVVDTKIYGFVEYTAAKHILAKP